MRVIGIVAVLVVVGAPRLAEACGSEPSNRSKIVVTGSDPTLRPPVFRARKPRCASNGVIIVGLEGDARAAAYIVHHVGGTTDGFRIPTGVPLDANQDLAIAAPSDRPPVDFTITVSTVDKDGKVGPPSAPYRVKLEGHGVWPLVDSVMRYGLRHALALAGALFLVLAGRVATRLRVRGRLAGRTRLDSV